MLLKRKPASFTPPADNYVWWRWGRIERPVQKADHKHIYKLSRYFYLAGEASIDKVFAGQPSNLE